MSIIYFYCLPIHLLLYDVSIIYFLLFTYSSITL